MPKTIKAEWFNFAVVYFAFYKVNSTWDENTVTWTTKPSYDMNLTSKQPGTNDPNKDYNDIDLTELTKDMLATQNYGYLMKLVNDEYYSKMNFCSSDHKDVSKRPVLKVMLGAKKTDIKEIAKNQKIDVFPNPTTGFLIGSRISNTQEKYYTNNVIQTVNNNSTAIDNKNILLGCYMDFTSNPALFSSKECAFASIGDGLTDTQASNFYTAVQAFQTTLSRNV